MEEQEEVESTGKSQEEILEIIRKGKSINDSYPRMAERTGLSEEEVRKLGKPFPWKLRDPQKAEISQEESLTQKIVRLKSISRLTYEQLSEKLNMPVEEIQAIYKPFLKQPHEKKKRERYKIGSKPKTLQYSIVEKFLKGTELENFWKKYKENSKKIGGNRENILRQPITKQDLEILRVYAVEFEKSLRDFAGEIGLPLSLIHSRALRTATKVIAQHPSVLDEVEVVD